MIEHPIASGSLVRAKNDQQVHEVEYHVTAEESENGVAFYYLYNQRRGCFDLDEDQITEIVATPGEARAKRVPTRGQVHRLLWRLCGEETDELSIDETEIDEDYVTLYGENEFGQRFAVEVCVSAIFPTDS